MMTMSGDATIPYNNENRNSLRASSSFKRYREKSSASGMRKETREQGVGIESETSRVRLPLQIERLLPVHDISW